MVYINPENGNFIVRTDKELYFLNKRNQYCYKTLSGHEFESYLDKLKTYETKDVKINNEFILGKMFPLGSKERLEFELDLANKKINHLESQISSLKDLEVKVSKIKLTKDIKDVESILLGFNSQKERSKFEQKEKQKIRREEIKKSEFNKILTKTEKDFYIKFGEIICSDKLLNFFKIFGLHEIDFGRRKYTSIGINSLNPKFRNEHLYDYRRRKSRRVVNSVYTLVADFFVLERIGEIIYKLPNQEIKTIKKPVLPTSLEFDGWDIIYKEENCDLYRINFNPFCDLKCQLKNHKETINVVEINNKIFLPEIEFEEFKKEIENLNESEIEMLLNKKSTDKKTKDLLLEVLDYKITPIF